MGLNFEMYILLIIIATFLMKFIKHGLIKKSSGSRSLYRAHGTVNTSDYTLDFGSFLFQEH
jgi:hypothetical protein